MSKQAAPHGVVVGVDGSASSLSAVRWAADEARLRHVPLTIVHVDDAQGSDEADTILAEAMAAGHEASDPDGPGVEGRRLTGKAVPELVEASREAQLTVVGSRGRTGRLSGSVGLGLLHHARKPVAIVHDDIAPRQGPGRRPILVGVDGSKTSLAAAEIAFDEASRRSADLLALHVCKDSNDRGAQGTRLSTVEQEAMDYLREALADLQQKYPEVAMHPLVRFANPTQQLLVQSERSQIVVMGSHGRGAVAGTLLGSVSAAVAEASRVPVIVARRT